MIRSLIPLFAVFFVIFSIPGTSQDLNTFDLNGAWEFRKAGTMEWKAANVPGVVHLDLMRNNIIEDPFYRDNELKVQWVGEIGWEYKRDFFYDSAAYSYRHSELVCKGLDTYANVYINDSLVIVADNMFKEWITDIRRYLKIGNNTIRIRFPSALSINEDRYKKLPYKLPLEAKSVSRKAAYQYGWDWGPTLITSGIWRDIYIRQWNYTNVLGVQFIQKKLTDAEAKISAVFTMVSQVKDSAHIRLFVDSVLVFDQKLHVKIGPNVIRGDFNIMNPERWWPNGMGKSFMYNCTWEVNIGGKPIGKGSQLIGLRTIELVQQTDSIGRSFYFKVNGKPVFVKGANYIPQDNFLPRVTDSAYKSLMRDVKEAGINMLRVWGGGVYEKDIFYDLCDRNGIMVWQDFMFANTMYPNNKEFINSLREEAIQNVVRLRRHPSIALWCGNNEIDEGWKNWGWQKQFGYSKADSTELIKNYRKIFNEILPSAVYKFDTLRPYVPTSPQYGWGRPQSLTKGDMHYWGVWWGKEPFSNYEKKIPRFMSEYGFQGFPDPSTINTFTAPEDRVLGSEVMKVHQKHPVGYETIDEYMLRDYRKPKDFESYGYVSQLLQAKGVSMAMQAHRRAKPLCMGTMFWQLNDCWPVVSWSARDNYGKKKALWYETKRQYGKMLISPVVEDGRVKVYISSDNPYIERDTMMLKLYDFDGNLLMDEIYYVEIPGNTSSVYYDTLKSSLISGLDSARIVFQAKLKGKDGMVAENKLYFTSPKDLKLEKPTIVKRAIETMGGYRILIISDQLVKNACLSTAVKGEFKDNYFDIIPGEIYEAFFSTREGDAKIADKIEIKSLVDTY